MEKLIKDTECSPDPFSETVPRQLRHGGGTVAIIVDREGFKYIVAEPFLTAYD
jgi:hypothetical protein